MCTFCVDYNIICVIFMLFSGVKTWHFKFYILHVGPKHKWRTCMVIIYFLCYYCNECCGFFVKLYF